MQKFALCKTSQRKHKYRPLFANWHYENNSMLSNSICFAHFYVSVDVNSLVSHFADYIGF